MKKVYTNGTIYTGREIFNGVAILTTDDKIEGFVYENDVPSGYEVIDVRGNNIAPAFIDLQIYGGNGHLFSAKPSIEAIEATRDYCLAGGCTQFLLTMATNHASVFSKGIEIVKDYWKSGGQNLAGLHIEGPWISDIKRGAHQREFIHPPTIEEVHSLIKESEGAIKMITLAPEVVQDEIVDLLQENGIVVSAGHSNATYNEAMHAFERINVATHLFNAMSAFQSREPGMVGAIYDHPSVMSSIVADGVHVDFTSLKISKRILGERLFLITDAVAETNEGPYRHVFKNDRYVLPNGTLSGSSLTMMNAVSNCIEHAGIPIDEALRMASMYPAKVLGVSSTKGLIERNYDASFVVFDNHYNILPHSVKGLANIDYSS